MSMRPTSAAVVGLFQLNRVARGSGSFSFRSNLSVSWGRRIHRLAPAMAPVKVGDALPDVELFEGAPNVKVKLADICKDGKVILFGVPGAFTPGCSKTHLPGYVAKAEEFKAKGVKEIICVSVNDPFVMGAWGEAHNAAGKVRMLADVHGALAKALDVEMDLSAVLGTVRCKRFSLLAENGTVTKVNIEPDGTGLSCSLAEKLVE